VRSAVPRSMISALPVCGTVTGDDDFFLGGGLRSTARNRQSLLTGRLLVIDRNYHRELAIKRWILNSLDLATR